MPIRPFKALPRNLVEWSRFFQNTEVVPSEGSIGEPELRDHSVTFQKLQNVQPLRLLGRITAPEGSIQELVVAGGVEFTASGVQRSALEGDITAPAGSNTTTFRNAVACSVVGRSANSDGATADIVAAANGHFFRRSGNALGFGAIALVDLPIALASGTYTPTLVTVANLDSATPFQFQYLRVGSVVTVSGRIDADPTAGGSATTQVRITLPIATTFAGTSNCAGTGYSSGITQGAAVFADTTNHEALLSWSSGTTASHNMFVTFTYRIA